MKTSNRGNGLVVFIVIMALLITGLMGVADDLNAEKVRKQAIDDAPIKDKETVEAYHAWCKLHNRWDIRLDEWKTLRKANLLPDKL